MRIGELDKRILLQAPTRVSNDKGGFTITWSNIAPVWAKKWTVSSTEQAPNDRVEMVRVVKFCIRFRNVLKSSWRIKYGDLYYDITGIDPDDKNEFIYLMTKLAV